MNRKQIGLSQWTSNELLRIGSTKPSKPAVAMLRWNLSRLGRQLFDPLVERAHPAVVRDR